MPGDTNGATDVFVRDRQTGTTQRVSVSPGGVRAMATATTRRSRRTGALSPSTRMPPTWCRATPTARTTCSSATARRARPERVSSGQAASRAWQQLRPGDLGGRALRRLHLGCQQPGARRHQRREDVFVRDRRTGTTRRVSVGPGGVQGNGDQRSFVPAISADGRFVAFNSDASNLVPGDTNRSSTCSSATATQARPGV